MNKDQWKHDAANKMAALRWHFSQLHKDAIGNIREDAAIDVRDFCQDVINKIDIFGQKHFMSFGDGE